MGKGIRRVGSGIIDPVLGITSLGIGISIFLRDQGSRCTIFVRSEPKICYVIEIKDRKLGYKNGICDENTYLVTTLFQSLGSL